MCFNTVMYLKIPVIKPNHFRYFIRLVLMLIGVFVNVQKPPNKEMKPSVSLYLITIRFFNFYVSMFLGRACQPC